MPLLVLVLLAAGVPLLILQGETDGVVRGLLSVGDGGAALGVEIADTPVLVATRLDVLPDIEAAKPKALEAATTGCAKLARALSLFISAMTSAQWHKPPKRTVSTHS